MGQVPEHSFRLDIFPHSRKFILAKKTLVNALAEVNSLYFAIFSARESVFFSRNFLTLKYINI